MTQSLGQCLIDSLCSYAVALGLAGLLLLLLGAAGVTLLAFAVWKWRMRKLAVMTAVPEHIDDAPTAKWVRNPARKDSHSEPPLRAAA